jgi:hypothetical protein
MPAQLRPDKKLAKIVYKLLNTQTDLQQRNTPLPTEKQREEWQTTYSKSAARIYQG